MRLKRFLLTLIFLALGFYFPLGGVWAQSTPVDGITLSEVQWNTVQARFDQDIAALITWLQDYQIRKKSLVDKITSLQNKTAELKAETQADSNVFKEIRLKELLSELKDKLEENSNEDREVDTKQKDFEQKCLSAIDLYNDRIEDILETGDVNESPASLDSKVNQLSELARKRNQIQVLLKEYRKKDNTEKPMLLSVATTLKTNDRETLQLTLDLFKDRQKNTEEQIVKWSLELDGLRNELKLQGEMHGFLKDIQDMNADSNFPQGNLKQEDLDFLALDSRKKKLSADLNEAQQKILQGQKLLMQINRLLTKVQDRLDTLNGVKKT